MRIVSKMRVAGMKLIYSLAFCFLLSCAANMIDLASHPERWKSMGRAGREHVENQHDVRRLTNRLEQLYESILNPGEDA